MGIISEKAAVTIIYILLYNYIIYILHVCVWYFLLGGYRDALRFRPGEQITFDPDAFIQSRPSSMRPFMEQLMQTQTFEQFVNDRLDTLNAGEGFSSDQFDIEVNMAGDKWGTQSRYKDWSNHMKVYVYTNYYLLLWFA